MTNPSVSVLAGLPTFTWNSDESVSYEVALEAITQAVAAYTALIRQAEEAGDTAAVAELTAAQARCVIDRDQLHAADSAQVAQVTADYRVLTANLREAAGGASPGTRGSSGE